MPQEPNGYSGYSGLFGNLYVAPVISPGGPKVDLSGSVITDGQGNNGFPDFGGITAPVGELAMLTLALSTKALAGDDATPKRVTETGYDLLPH